MFSELSEEALAQAKAEIQAFMLTNAVAASVNLDQYGSLTISHANAWKVLQELTKEQKRRRNGGSPFIAVDMRRVSP